jgi:hypothetical protein
VARSYSEIIRVWYYARWKGMRVGGFGLQLHLLRSRRKESKRYFSLGVHFRRSQGIIRTWLLTKTDRQCAAKYERCPNARQRSSALGENDPRLLFETDPGGRSVTEKSKCHNQCSNCTAS